MKLACVFAAGIIVGLASFASADIIGNTIADDGDGVMQCTTYGFQTVAPHEFQLNIDGVHNIWDRGDILGNIITDTPLDPKLTLLHEIDNDTGSTWTDYHAQVTLNAPFTIDNVTVANVGWTYVVTQPTLSGGEWVGTVDYYAGTPVPDLGTLDFGYRLTFAGTVAFAEQLTPTPEPATMGLLVLGGLGLLARRRR